MICLDSGNLFTDDEGHHSQTRAVTVIIQGPSTGCSVKDRSANSGITADVLESCPRGQNSQVFPFTAVCIDCAFVLQIANDACPPVNTTICPNEGFLPVEQLSNPYESRNVTRPPSKAGATHCYRPIKEGVTTRVRAPLCH